MKPIDDRASVEAALDRFLRRQLQSALNWIAIADGWRADAAKHPVGPYFAEDNAKRCDHKAFDIGIQALRLHDRISARDKTRRADHVTRHWKRRTANAFAERKAA